MHPFVSGMGMGEMDAGCGPSRSKGVETGAGQEAGCQNSRLFFTRYFGNGLKQWRQPLSAPSHALSPARSCRCIHLPHPHSAHPLRFIFPSAPLKSGRELRSIWLFLISRSFGLDGGGLSGLFRNLGRRNGRGTVPLPVPRPFLRRTQKAEAA